MPSPTETYLADLRRQLRGNPLLARRVLAEVSDHLTEAVAAARRSGMSQQDAEEDAVRRFGPPAPFARQFDRFGAGFKALLLFSTVATVVVALWLFWVIAVVLPAHDPARIPLWRGVALAFLGYSALSWAFLLAGPRNPVLRFSVVTASAAAIACGGYGIVRMILAAARGEHFEGYILLMGLILAGHGCSAIAYTVLTRRIERRVRAA
ncbi:MAG TPA: permease prefix domain 1-containing protein [Candidatus Polarisedimenticolaceae bacterium]|nr:permease prefix domain 1-containing protein [Candidatus Polarisedimenticolaceae bacterium]